MPKITVVFEYIEGAELPKRLTAAFASESMAFDGATITAISMEDEISRVEALEAEQIDSGQSYDAAAFISVKDRVMGAVAVIKAHGREHGVRVEYPLHGEDVDRIRSAIK